jgi:hypothetical protein
MKMLAVGLTALLIAVQCFAGPPFMRLAKKIEFAAKYRSLYKPQTQTLRNAMANKEATTLEHIMRGTGLEYKAAMANEEAVARLELAEPRSGLDYKADPSTLFVAAETEAKHLLVDPVAARKAVKPMEKEDPQLAKAIFKDLAAGQRYTATKMLGGFTIEDINYKLKEPATMLPQQTKQELQDVANISNKLVKKAVDELPDQFFGGPTKPPVDSSMQKAVGEHKPGVMGERITYNSSAFQLEFEFDSPQVTLNRASADIRQRFDQYRAMIKP